MKNIVYSIVGLFSFFFAKRSRCKVYIGCGDDTREGYIGCDIRRTPAVKIQCAAWKLSKHCENVSDIYTRHMLEHLTFPEVEAALSDWYWSLGDGGRLEIIVPNMDFHIKQWLNADWSESSFEDKWSDMSWSLAGFWGWQRDCAVSDKKKVSPYWDVHKSGFNEPSIKFFLVRAGFSDIETSVVDGCHLLAVAYK